VPFVLLRRGYLGLAAFPIEPAMKLLMFAWAAIVVSIPLQTIQSLVATLWQVSTCN
jgi:hypothetical protein